MLPFAEVGSLNVSTYAVLKITALIVAGMLSFHRPLTGGIPVQNASRGLFLSILSGIAGAFRLGSFNILLTDPFLTEPSVERGGSTFEGALTGALGFAWLYYSHYGIPPSRVLDRVCLPGALGHATGHVGCLCAGRCYGRATKAWPGMHLPDVHGNWAVRYSTQLTVPRMPHPPPFVFGGSYSQTLSLREPVSDATRLIVPLEYRLERLDFLTNELPSAEGEHWAALGVSPAATARGAEDERSSALWVAAC